MVFMCDTAGKKFRKKPIVIEAIQWTGENLENIELFFDEFYDKTIHDSFDNSIIITTLEGDHKAKVGDWIIKGIKGEFYPCKPDIFKLTYEKVID